MLRNSKIGYDWLFQITIECYEVRNSRVTKSSYKTELRKMTLHFELRTRTFFTEIPSK